MLRGFHQTEMIEAGCDEAGRGCYAGPVFAAAVILPTDFHHPLLNDSKQVHAADRKILRHIIETHAMAWAVGSISNQEIDKINILQASYKAMHLAIDQLKIKPGLLLIDGNRFKPYKKIPYHCIVKGDGLYTSIAAASILAKTHRDAYMEQLDKSFPHYGWTKNKGYGTRKHREAIEQYGLCEHHRMSFNINPKQE